MIIGDDHDGIVGNHLHLVNASCANAAMLESSAMRCFEQALESDMPLLKPLVQLS